MELLRPPALRAGDRVAAVTLSWGGAAACPERYEVGSRQLEETFGLRVVDMPHTRRDPEWIAANPRARAEDLMAAFADDSIRGIVSVIGGEESIRILPFLDPAVIRANPKVFVGFSDTTVTHMACLAAGLGTFYGPAILAGFGENGGIFPYLAESFRRATFVPEPMGVLEPNPRGWTVEHLDWAVPENQSIRRTLQPCTPWRYLQGEGVHTGHLIGGCFEVLEWMRGLPLWPSPERWNRAVLFLETSEEAVPPNDVARALRVYAAEGVLERLAGILFGRPGGPVDPATFEEYDRAILRVVRDEQGLGRLPIVTGMDFGHTEPFLTLPYGVRAEIDCDRRRVSVLDAAVTPRGES